MTKFIIIFLLLLVPASFAANGPVGRLWGNLIHEETTEENNKPHVSFQNLSFSERAKVLNFYTLEALHKAQFTHKVSDMQIFIALQDYWLRESSIYKKVFEQAMLASPQYDYTVTHPTSAIGLELTDKNRQKQRQKFIKKIAKTHGLLFFYRGHNSFDKKQIPIIKNFATRFNLTLIPVAVDGIKDHAFATSRIDNGEAEALGLRFFPATLLVNPHTEKTKPLAYGLLTEDMLEQRFLLIGKQINA